MPHSISTLKLGETYSHKIMDENWPNSIVNLILAGSKRNIHIINNLPHISNITFTNLEVEIDNLPSTIQTIKLDKIETKDKLKKIPFGCELT